jgi:hypothetical protein
MIFVGDGRFNIRIKDRFGKTIRNPTFIPPVKFKIERNYNPGNLIHVVPLPLVPDLMNFQFTYEKKLSADETKDGCMVGFCV